MAYLILSSIFMQFKAELHEQNTAHHAARLRNAKAGNTLVKTA